MRFSNTHESQVEEQKPLLLERIVILAKNGIYKTRETFASAMIFGLLAHLFMLVNKLPNHDDVFYLFGKGATISSGRWGLEILSAVLPNYSMPWFHGVISLLLLAILSCLIVDLLEIRTKLYRVLLAGLIVTFPVQVGVFSYMFTSSAYAVSFLCAVLSVWLFLRGSRIGKMAAVMLLAFSISIYQTYLMVASSLLLVYMLKQLVADDLPWKQVLRNGIGYVLFLAAAFVLYYAVLVVLQNLVVVDWSAYAADTTAAEGPLWKRILLCYPLLRDELLRGIQGLAPTPFSCILYGILVLFCAAAGVLWALRKRDAVSVLFALGLVMLLPISINAAYLITNFYYVHTLMLYSFIAVFLVAVVFAENVRCTLRSILAQKAYRLLREVSAFALAALLFVQVFVANEKYLGMHMAYETIYSYYTTLITRVQSQPQYKTSMRLALVGKQQSSAEYRALFEENVGQIMGTSHVNIAEKMYSRAEFIRYYIGSDIMILSDAEAEQIAKTETVLAMPCYPNDGSICIIDDIVVVKLSDATDWTSQ